MAEEINNNVADTTEIATENSTPTVDELMERITQLEADRNKYKLVNDKLSKESADYKRQLRAKQSEDERISAEQAEAQRLRDEEFEAIKAENNRMKAIGAYKSISNEQVVENLIEAISKADHIAIAKILESEVEARVKIEKAEWLKSRPQANIGSYSTMTKEQIMEIQDRNERMKAIAQNQNLFI